MTNVFEFDDYKAFVREWMATQPNKGRGILTKIALDLDISPTMISHIINGEKDLSLEAAAHLADFIGLSEDAGEFLLLLVQFSRAGSFKLKEKLRRQILKERQANRKIEKKVKADLVFSDNAKNQYYSSWVYSGVRNMVACPTFTSRNDVARHLGLSFTVVNRVIDFLVANELLKEKNGNLAMGPQSTHIARESPLVIKHHQNWRTLGFQRMLDEKEDILFYTCPMSLSRQTADLVRERLPLMIEEIINLVKPSPSEVVRCLNIDWFDY